MKKIKDKVKDLISKNNSPLDSKKSKLSKADVDDIKSALTEIELRDR